MFTPKSPDANKHYLSRFDPQDPLSSYSEYAFGLDNMHWPTVEHYFQAMRFNNISIREKIRSAERPNEARQWAKKYFWRMRFDWKKVRQTMMTRALYTKCMTHKKVADLLLDTGDKIIEDTSQYDYYWGRGRDGRGHNKFGIVLMNVRAKLRESKKINHGVRPGTRRTKTA